MRSPAEAIQEILGRLYELGEIEPVGLAEVEGRVLGCDVASDIDLPPFEKSAVDGFAVHSADFAPGLLEAGPRRLAVVGESRAGAPFVRAVERGACVAIYTGAELPPDTDAVVMVEESQADGAGVLLRDRPRIGQHVCHRGQDIRTGQVVARKGRRLGPADLSLLASVGCDPVQVVRRPRVAIVTTGDELVPPTRRPAAGQIREGNTLQLAAQCRRSGAVVENLGIVRDDEAELDRVLGEALARCDVLVTTGGVSVGKYDLVGAALARLGVEEVFHKIAMKPGKPLWFGLHNGRPVFALPGNPVSCFVGCELFVRPALARLSGVLEDPSAARERWGRWCGPDVQPLTREQYIPVVTEAGGDGIERIQPVPWNGSADVVGLSKACALAVVPANQAVQPEAPVRYRTLD